MWHVYILKCKDNKLYTGITKNLKRRLNEHRCGRGGRFTRIRTPVKLVYYKNTLNRSRALKKEAEIKKLSRKSKLDLIGSLTIKKLAEVLR